MKWEVKLYVGGKVFSLKEVYASTSDAKENSNKQKSYGKRLSVVNPIVGETSSWDNDDDDDYSSNQSSSSSSSHSVGDSMGMVMLLGALLLIGVIITYWYIVIPVSLIIGILCYIGGKD